ncbi:MAG: bifunctional 5,10-methylenetetrahydrofolate dehydrogenase/5,10-methenyltetrahydrofolate cyclohydrolase [Candidatus Cloacimonetes bacterium]|jgi:methylenetetrahydrofolate dehydrogenase (NADP+)/methenyltetrahydrofolate cyclohydrolase|nr:bifunctional 5,10-methylenetetrahydrofolate dehydrogenase/5,10-methenyltetrahydrofolate cyclohydrolase [Candidatus Cloacimonadota bacterium]MDY0171884.1 bifunctional 5,10-methylenetetrahydrofolate dehydrogenase/5,10-methenyltetrahydrofolate cyclohydrolase [Candidatus Cloacimonadaceae bacterium]
MQKELKGKAIALAINKVSKALIQDYDLSPTMRLIQVGEDPASSYYVQSIVSTASRLGCTAELLILPNTASQDELLKAIQAANEDSNVHGIMLQKPLPKTMNDSQINMSIDPDKDIDALHPLNLGKILMQEDGFLPNTPAAVYYTLKYYDIDPMGKNVVVLGRSNVVGKPLANMLLWKKPYANATVTVCHSRTSNLKEICLNAEILIAAIGKANFVSADMIKAGAVLIDVGINEMIQPDGSSIYVGDIDYEACYEKALAITPVPGGIGRITTSLLYLNLVKASLIAKKVNKNVDEYIDLIFGENQKK